MEEADEIRERAKAFAQEAGIPFEHFEALAVECEDDPRKLSVLAATNAVKAVEVTETAPRDGR